VYLGEGISNAFFPDLVAERIKSLYSVCNRMNPDFLPFYFAIEHVPCLERKLLK
jgi:hypothetical protein